MNVIYIKKFCNKTYLPTSVLFDRRGEQDYSREVTIQGGNYRLEKGFDRGNNSREETI